ncbi:hypothetical protein HMPREF9194_00481 [Treponema maltophilum ATCC 51939]|uniref:Uncharacterized protein n=1 Tax=Treponema maltophilum ATCC 51939 TaxID=1125699 RepID=S3K157_TREMA|nr:hypothetical protein HMPREF9194_00481 [Treponema maltophilum ATCC 51939]
MKFFRDSYRLTVSACEHFCTNHISTTVYVVVYTVVGLSSSFVYHKNQVYFILNSAFYKVIFFRGVPRLRRVGLSAPGLSKNCSFWTTPPLLSLTRMRAVERTVSVRPILTVLRLLRGFHRKRQCQVEAGVRRFFLYKNYILIYTKAKSGIN